MTKNEHNGTKAASGQGNIRLREDGRWEARYITGTDPGTGKPIRKSVYGITQTEVRKKLTKATASIDEGDYFEPTKITVKTWLNTWLDEYCDDKKWSTQKHYRAQCNAHIIPSLGAVKLAEINAIQIQKFYNSMLRGSNGKKALAPKSVKNIHGILTKALTTACKLGYLKSNPADNVTLPRIERKEIHPLTDEQVKELLKLLEDEEYENYFKTLLFSGMRESEGIGLTNDSIDFEKGTILINKQLQKRPIENGGFTFTSLKNGKSRKIKPAPYVMEVLKEQKIQQEKQRLIAGELWQGWNTEEERKTALVFTTANGQNYSPQTVYNHYKKLAAKIGAEDTCVHDLRHTYAVMSLQNGDDIKTVQGNLGHATAAFTLDVYGHFTDKMRDNSSERMQKFIDGLNEEK